MTARQADSLKSDTLKLPNSSYTVYHDGTDSRVNQRCGHVKENVDFPIEEDWDLVHVGHDLKLHAFYAVKFEGTTDAQLDAILRVLTWNIMKACPASAVRFIHLPILREGRDHDRRVDSNGTPYRVIAVYGVFMNADGQVCS